MTTDLARKSTVRELVAAFQATEATVRRCFAELVDAEQALNFAFTLGNDRAIRISSSDHWASDFTDADRAVEKLQRDAWRVIVERLEMRRAMSIKAWGELEKALDNEPLPAITEANVEAFAARFAQDLPSMLREAVQEVFEWLRPHHSEYKRNSEYEVPARVILPNVIEPGWRGKLGVNHYRQQNLVALENVFNSLAGNGAVAKAYQSQLQTAIEASPTGVGETDLFRFRACKNRNLHLQFLRLDLLSRFNRVAGGRRMRSRSDERECA